MFTGIIQTQAHIQHIQKKGNEAYFTFSPLKMFSKLEQGESIAVNGVCLTVETFTNTSFSAYASSKTLELTNLGTLSIQDCVNLERALALGDRLGGHIVSGHVDSTIQVLNIEDKLSAKICTLELPQKFLGLIISQGSVCLDGISLTVSELYSQSFSVHIIPETWKQTTVSHWKKGSKVNLETDIIGKYIHSRTSPYTEKLCSEKKEETRITEEFLKQMGY